MDSEKIVERKPYCCVIGCENDARWEIQHGINPDDYTHACDHHISDLLTDAYEHRIIRLNWEESDV